MTLATMADDDWEWADETGFFCEDWRNNGFVERPEDRPDHDGPVYDAMMFARAIAETRPELCDLGICRSRGPGRRIRDRYWDPLPLR